MDGKSNRAIRDCNVMHRAPRVLEHGKIKLGCGCPNRVTVLWISCSFHGGDIQSDSVLLHCPDNHTLHLVDATLEWEHVCDDKDIPTASSVWRCLHVCELDLCEACLRSGQRQVVHEVSLGSSVVSGIGKIPPPPALFAQGAH